MGKWLLHSREEKAKAYVLSFRFEMRFGVCFAELVFVLHLRSGPGMMEERNFWIDL